MLEECKGCGKVGLRARVRGIHFVSGNFCAGVQQSAIATEGNFEPRLQLQQVPSVSAT